MAFFTNNPFTKLLSFWLTGILAASYYPRLILVFVLFGILFGILAFSRIQSKRYPFDQFMSAFWAIIIMITAFFSGSVPNTLIKTHQKPYHFLATLVEQPIEKQRSYAAQLEINCCDSGQFNGKKLMAYFEKKDSVMLLQAGDQIFVKSRLNQIQNQGNPYEFDYQKYMANNEINYSTYIRSDNYSNTTTTKQKSIFVQAKNLRSKLIRKLKSAIKNDESIQVISALTLGYRKELSAETKTSFAATGAMHVLAVSGLHVGMIFLFLSNLFSFLKQTKFGNILFFLIIASLLWFYALLTGFSPSVQRATVMFTIILLANCQRRPTSIYNSIAASAFILLLFNPKLITELGFQLSYSAVISIVFLFPKIEKLLAIKNKILKKVWQVFCISLAAQAGTFALSIYYFHQFPVYFWLSNFIVIPAAYLILGFTFLFFALTPFNYLATLLAKLLSLICYSTIQLLQQIEQLPHSLIQNISISYSQLWLLIGMCLSLVFFIKQKKKIFILATSGFILLFLVAGIIEKSNYYNQQKMIRYANNSSIHLINGRFNYVLFKNENLPNKYAINNVIRKLRLNPPVYVCLDSCNTYLSDDLLISNNTIQFLDQTFEFEKRRVKLKQPNFSNKKKIYRKENKNNNEKTGNEFKRNRQFLIIAQNEKTESFILDLQSNKY